MPHVTTALSINDGLATPVLRAFDPRRLGVELSEFAYKKATTDPKDQWVTATLIWSDSTPKRPTVRQLSKIAFPIVRTIDGVPTVVDIARSEVTFVIPDSMTVAEIDDLHQFTRNWINHPTVRDGVQKREPIFG